MNIEHNTALHDPRIAAALAELRSIVSSQYPAATFAVERGADDPAAIHLVTTVDVDDPDEVTDLTIGRELELQLDEGLPVHVIPVRTPERVEQLRHQVRTQRPPLHAHPQLHS